MFVPKNHEITMRCPVCFNRDIDVLMKYEEDKTYACQKCSYTGSEADVREYYKYLQSKFRNINKRITVEDYEKM